VAGVFACRDLDVERRTAVNKARRRWPRRLALAAGCGALSLLALVAVLRSEPFARYLRGALISSGSAFVEEDLHIQDLELQLWPLGMDLVGITAHSRDHLRPGQEILHIDRVSVEGIRLRGGRRIEIDRLEIDQPRARLRVANGDLRDFPGLRRSRNARVELFLGELVLQDAAVTLSVDRPDVALDVRGIDVVLTSGPDDTAEASLRVDDTRIRVAGVEERVELRSGHLARQGERFALRDYQFVSPSGTLALSGEMTLSPKDERGAIVGALGYEVDVVAELDLAAFYRGNPELPPMEGRLDLHALAEGIDADPLVDGDLELSGGRFGKHVIGDAEVRLRYHEGGVNISRAWFGHGGGEVTGAGRIVFGEQTTVFADLRLQELQLAEVFESNTLPDPWVMMDIDGTARLDGLFADGMQLLFDVDLDCRDLRVYDSSFRERPFNRQMLHLPAGRLTGSVEVLPDRTLLRGMKIVTAHSDLDVDVEFVYHKPVLIDLRVDADTLALQDVSPLGNVPFAGKGPADVHIYGLSKDLQIDAHTVLAGFELWDLPLGDIEANVFWHARDDLVFEDLVASVGTTTYTGDGRLVFGQPIQVRGELAVDDGRIEDVTGIFTDRLDAAGAFDGGIAVSGPIDALDGRAWIRGRQVSLLGEFFSSIQVTASARQGRFTFNDTYLRKGRGGVFGRGFIDTHGPLNVELFTYAMDLEQIDVVQRSSLPLTAAVDAEVHLWGTLSSPLMHGSLRLRDTQYARAGLGDSLVDLTLREGTLRVNGTLLGRAANRLTGELGMKGDAPYSFAFDWYTVPLHLLLPARTLARSPVTLLSDGHVEGRGHLKGEPDHRIALQMDRIELERGEEHVRNAEPVRLVLDGTRLRIESLRLTGKGTDLSATGTVAGKALDLRVDGDLDLAVADIFVPALGRCEADGAEVHLAVVGPWPAADVEAVLHVRDGSIRVDQFPHPIEVDRALITLRDDEVKVESFDGRLGGGKIQGVAGSRIQLLDLKPHEYDIHAQCVGCTVRYPSYLPWSRSTADLSLTGTAPMVTLQGDIAVEDMTYREDFAWQSSLFGGAVRRERAATSSAGSNPTVIGLDLRIHGDGGFGIANNLGQARASGEVRIIGDTTQPGIDGEIRTTGGRVWFRGHDFDLTEGLFTFPDPYALDPHLHLVLDSDVATREQRYSIHYVIDGLLSEMGNLHVVGSADPHLSEADINALLLFGVTADELQGLAGGSDMAALAAQGLNIVSGYLMEQVREAGGTPEQGASALPDRIELVPDYSSSSSVSEFRLVVGKDLIRNRLSGEFYWNFRQDFGFALDWRVGRNLYLVPSWFRGSERSLGALTPFGDLGNVSLDMRWVLEGD